MKDVRALFEGGELNGEAFAEKLREAGLVVLEATEGGYVPASRLDEQQRAFDDRLTSERAGNALRLELVKSGAHNPSIAASAIGIEGICGDECEMAAAASAKVAALKSAEPYMFSSAHRPDVCFSTGGTHGTAGVDPDRMTDSEYYKYRNVK